MADGLAIPLGMGDSPDPWDTWDTWDAEGHRTNKGVSSSGSVMRERSSRRNMSAPNWRGNHWYRPCDGSLPLPEEK